MTDQLHTLLERSARFHDDLFPLWEDLPSPRSKRMLAVVGFCRIVQQHVIGQHILLESGLDVPAMTLVRPSFEAAVRAIWCLKGASDEWVEKFMSPPDAEAAPDAETVLGPAVDSMLLVIRKHHPQWLHDALLQLRTHTWKAMHSYVHGGIRPVVQSLSELPEQKQCAVLLNANAFLILATNVLRMAHGVPSPILSDLQRQYASCLPP
jgi:hypothetical protein